MVQLLMLMVLLCNYFNNIVNARHMHTYSSSAQLLQLAVMSDLFVLELEVVPKYNTSKQAISVYCMYVLQHEAAH